LHPVTQREDGVSTRVRDVRDDGIVRTRCRSFCFLQRGGARWTAFLITYVRANGQWRGYFNFRTALGETGIHEVRTADLFVEQSEAELDQRARGLGRPLLLALLESALDADERRRGFSPDLQRWFRELLDRHAQRDGDGMAVAAAADASLAQLRSLYESYRLEQVAHLITLLSADDFRELVEILLDGRRIDFRDNDRLQLAMSVVQDLERRLLLPPFEVWVEDYLANTEVYREYSRWLHGGGEASVHRAER
jgi:hypothetical protein